eukprot:13830874-Heterocapsa_arctica.AAC.1
MLKDTINTLKDTNNKIVQENLEEARRTSSMVKDLSEELRRAKGQLKGPNTVPGDMAKAREAERLQELKDAMEQQN